MNIKKTLIILAHAFSGWVLCAATIGIGMAATSLNTALIIHAVAAPVFFAGVSLVYFRKFNYTTPLQTAVIFHRLGDRHGFLRGGAADQPQFGYVHQPAGDVDPICADFYIHLADGNAGYKIPQAGNRRLKRTKEGMMSASVLVGFSTVYGSTQEVAESIAETLHNEGFEVNLQPARQVRSLAGVQAVVLGAPLYMFRWHNDARHFLSKHRKALQSIPVAIFALGPFHNKEDEMQSAPGNTG